MGQLFQRDCDAETSLSFFYSVVFRTRFYTCHDGIFSGFFDQGMIRDST